MQCGLLGEKLGHSYSPQIHNYLGNYTYDLFPKSPDEIEDFLKQGNFHGLNVTIPYKKTVIPYCDSLSDIARRLGAVNTIIKQPDGRFIGHNTDYFGFATLLAHSNLQVAGKKALVLGSGGASATVVTVLKDLGASVVVISRTGENNYNNLHLHKDASIIVNTTPVGMYPNSGISPIDLNRFPKLDGVLDLIYNPARTQLLLDAESRGIVAENGLLMLIAQAKESAEWFTEKKIDDSIILKIYQMLQTRMENIVLIGMPGCGKSSIGKLLAQKLGKTFVDADTEIEKAAGKPIPEIFAQSGEEGFRSLEIDVLKTLGMQSGTVIATGGGCVTKAENYPSLRQNGRILWLRRDISALATDGRPLSQQGNLDRMYAIRKPLYESFADLTFDNLYTPEVVADNIIAKLKQEAYQ